jgi:hypothetical protein
MITAMRALGPIAAETLNAQGELLFVRQGTAFSARLMPIAAYARNAASEYAFSRPLPRILRPSVPERLARALAIRVMVLARVVTWLRVSRVRLFVSDAPAVPLVRLMSQIILKTLKGLIFVLRLVRSVRLAVV